MRQPGAFGGPTPPDARQLDRAHDAFLADGVATAAIRPLVLESWRRSMRNGVDPETVVAPVTLDDAALADLRENHPLAAAMPVIRELLVRDAEQAGLIVGVSDAAGRMLWVEGDRGLRSRAERMNFLPGSSWSERDAGTNAPGTALALDREVQIYRSEHLARTVTPWSCSAAPVHDPDTGSLLGVLDVTGGDDVAGPTTLALVRATVRAVEAELRLNRLVRPTRSSTRTASHPRLQVLGRSQAEWRTGCRQQRLSLRHSEMLLLLSQAPDGLRGDELEAGLSDDPLAPVTVRAELSRLRQAVLPYTISTRPYRLEFELDSDVARLCQALRDRDHRTAVGLYTGPVLPRSEAPAVVELRERLHLQLRSLLLSAADPDSLLRFADTCFGRDDLALWQAAEPLLPPGSIRLTEVTERVRQLRNQFFGRPPAGR
jgi:transcriptional regulator of acetoin/glycerol metabolism